MNKELIKKWERSGLLAGLEPTKNYKLVELLEQAEEQVLIEHQSVYNTKQADMHTFLTIRKIYEAGITSMDIMNVIEQNRLYWNTHYISNVSECGIPAMDNGLETMLSFVNEYVANHIPPESTEHFKIN